MRNDIPDVEEGEDILADWGNQVRDMAAARDIGDSYQGVASGGYHSHRMGTTGVSGTIRYGILKTALDIGKSCIIEERTFQSDGSLQCSGDTFRAYRPLGDYYGIADEACVTWLIDGDGPTADELDDLGITLPAGAPTPTEDDIASLQSITCVGFVCECSNVPET
jgi:hypothetical protein